MLWCCSFPKAERQRLNAALVERGLATACRFTDAKLANLKLMPYPKEFVQLRYVNIDSASVLTVFSGLS